MSLLSEDFHGSTSSSDQAFYDGEAHYLNDPNFMPRHLALRESYMAGCRSAIDTLAAGGRKLSTLELGAGTCMLSLMLSREPWLRTARCVDISSKRMSVLAGEFAARIPGCRLELLSFAQGDFSQPLPFADGAFDIILFDAALHHSRDIWLTLRECHRMLAPDGLLIAQREQYLARFSYGFALRRILRSREVRSGVAENAFLKEQYEYYLRATGFLPRFVPVSPGWLRWLSPFNGTLFSKWTVIASRRHDRPVFD
jgi:SAM-dependent methyltransferase